MCPEGFLPIFSVETEQEARQLLGETCKMGLDKHYYAPELESFYHSYDQEGRLDAFYAFGERLSKVYQKHLSRVSK